MESKPKLILLLHWILLITTLQTLLKWDEYDLGIAILWGWNMIIIS